MLPDPHAQLRTLVEALSLASLPADDQLAALPRDAPRELARIHDDVWYLVPGLRAAGLVGSEAADRLAAFDRHHEEMAEDAALWTPDALRDDPRWEESRGLAAAALAALRA